MIPGSRYLLCSSATGVGHQLAVQVGSAVYRYLFSTTGINACSYSTRIAGVYSLVFTVTNSQGLSASVTRTLVVQPTCYAGEILCPDKARSSSKLGQQCSLSLPDALAMH